MTILQGINILFLKVVSYGGNEGGELAFSLGYQVFDPSINFML